MHVMQAIRGRRAVRDYRPEPVSSETIYQLIAAASWAPSGMNQQPWHFTVVTDAALLDEISAKAKAWMLDSVRGLPREAHFREIMADPQFHLFYHAPALIVISTTAPGQWGREDCALAAQNLMLAAVPLGLGTCWIGFAQVWLNSPEGKEFLNLPREALVVAPIVVGNPKAIPPAGPRKAPAVSWIGQHGSTTA